MHVDPLFPSVSPTHTVTRYSLKTSCIKDACKVVLSEVGRRGLCQSVSCISCMSCVAESEESNEIFRVVITFYLERAQIVVNLLPKRFVLLENSLHVMGDGPSI